MRAEKFMEKKRVGNIESRIYHVIDDIPDLKRDELDMLLKLYEDKDGEDLYFAGIYSSIEDEFFAVKVDDFIKSFEATLQEYDEYQKDWMVEDYVAPDNTHLFEIIEKLKKYDGYTIYLNPTKDDNL